MQLPFTRGQFFDLFVAHNEALWPAAVALWSASAVIVALRLSTLVVIGASLVAEPYLTRTA